MAKVGTEGRPDDDPNLEQFLCLMKQWYIECVYNRSGYGSTVVEVVDYGAVINIEERFKTRLVRNPKKPPA